VDWSSLFSGFLGAGLGGGVLTLYLDHRFSIRRDKLREERAARLKQRNATAAVVEIISEWVRTAYLGTEFDGEAKWRLQTTYWKNILLLDKELVCLICPRLANDPGAVDTKELIVQARRILLGLKMPDIHASELNTWPPKDKAE
jgi:hypothetical protein